MKTIMLFQFLILVTASNVLSGFSPVFSAVHQGGNFINFFFPDKLNVKSTLHTPPDKLVD